MAIFNGDIVVDDKQTGEKTAAASSRGLAGSPASPEDMPQSTPAASSFMQVSGPNMGCLLDSFSAEDLIWI